MKLSNKSSSLTHRLPYLDNWRAVAILCVLIGHFFPLPGFDLGPFGVELFFVLSGRLMAEILFIERFPLREFYIRRFSRIYPALAVLVIAIGTIKLFTSATFNPKAILLALTFTYNYDMGISSAERTSSLDHIWSLCVEEHAYVLLGFIAYLSRRYVFSPTALIGAITLAAMINGVFCTYVLGQNYFQAYWRTDVHIASIFCSSAVYLAIKTNSPYARKIAQWNLLPLTYFVIGVALNLNIFPWPVKCTFGTFFLACAVCTLDLAHPRLKKLMSSSFLSYIGITSYSVYLCQQPFYKLADHMGGNLLALALLAAGVSCGLVSYYVIEQPARRFINGYLKAVMPFHYVQVRFNELPLQQGADHYSKTSQKNS